MLACLSTNEHSFSFKKRARGLGNHPMNSLVSKIKMFPRARADEIILSLGFSFFVFDLCMFDDRMEFQANEILEHIFKQLPRLKSITNCYNTNQRWRKILTEMFKKDGMF